MSPVITIASDADWPEIWAMLEPVFRTGETYAYAPDISESDAKAVWLTAPAATYIARAPDGAPLGTYYVKANQPGLGAHVCNCGYVTSEAARGQGIASAMCDHSQVEARNLGFRAMQYNLVAATNSGAVRLWQKHGFDLIGTLPGAFNHQGQGYVDAHIMYKSLL